MGEIIGDAVVSCLLIAAFVGLFCLINGLLIDLYLWYKDR